MNGNINMRIIDSTLDPGAVTGRKVIGMILNDKPVLTVFPCENQLLSTRFAGLGREGIVIRML